MDEDKTNLIIRAKNGDNQALEQLLKGEETNIKTMIFYLKKNWEDINDIVQNILFKVSVKIKQLNNPNSFKSWLNQIVLNTYYDYLRKNKKYSKDLYLDEQNEAKYFNIPDYSTNPSQKILDNELDFVIKTSIDNLPIHYKIPITLREIQGLSYSEISNITKTTVGTVKSRIARARALIKNDIDKYIGE